MHQSRLIIGYGYLGRQVGSLWTEQGHHVCATSRRPENFNRIQTAGLHPALWDVTQDDNQPLPQVDVVLYCVGFDRGAGHSMRHVYVDGLARTLERLPECQQLIYASSTGVYGDADGDWVDESTPPHPTDPSGEVCLEAEAILIEHCQQHGIAYTILRLSGIYGPDRLIGAASLKQGQPVAADPDVYLNLIEVSDAARVVDAVCTAADPDRLYNVSDGNPATRREFYDEVARLLQLPSVSFDPDSARRARGNRRVSNRKMLAELKPTLQFPDFRSGLRNALREVHS